MIFESIMIFIGKQVVKYGINKVLDKVFEKKEEYTKHLSGIISKTVDEFEKIYPNVSEEEMFSFHQSEIIIQELLKYRIFGEKIDENRIKTELAKKSNIHETELEKIKKFIEIFDEIAINDEKLKGLEIESTYKQKIFDLFKLLTTIKSDIEEIKTSIETLKRKDGYKDIINQLLDSSFEKFSTVQQEKFDDSIDQKLKEQTQQIISALSGTSQIQAPSIDFEELNKHFETDIELIKEDIEKNNVNSALKRLLSLKDNSWDKANDNIKFKIISNIGVIYSKTDKLKEAAEYFIEAYKLSPDNEKAINNVTIALIYLNKYDYKIVQDIKKHAPEKAVSIDIRFNAKDKKIEDIVSELDEEFLNDLNVLLSIANHAHKIKDFDNAIKYTREAFNVDKNSITQKENLANSIFVKFEGYSQFLFSYTKNSKDKKLIVEAIKLYEECWEDYKIGDTKKYKIDIKAKLALLYSLLGKADNALQNIKSALEEKADDEYFQKFKALFLSQTDKYNEAIEIFSSITNFEKHPDVPMSLAYCYFFKKEDDKAAKVLKEYINIGQNNQFVKNARGLLIDILIQTKQYNEADQVADDCLSLDENDYDFLISKSRILHFLKDTKKPKEILDEVIKEADNIEDDRTLTYIAKALEEQNRVEEAVEFYEKSIDLTQNNDFTYKIAFLYTTINRKDKALEIYRDLRIKYGIIENITINEIALYQEMGELKSASEIAEKYLEVFPDDLNLKVSLIGINLNLEYHVKNRELLYEDIKYLSLDIKHFSIYIALLKEYEFNDKAALCLYEAWRHFRNVDYNDLYLSFYFQLSLNRKETIKTCNKVETNCVVYLLDDNEKEYYFIFDDKPEKELKQNEQNIHSKWFKLLEGKKDGDKIQIAESPVKEHVKITRITHKYIYALNEARNLSSSIYKGKSVFKQFNIDKFKELIESEANKGELRNIEETNFINSYKLKKLPIGFFSSYYDESSVKTWFNNVSSDRGLECSLGFPDEMSGVLDNINKYEDFDTLYIDIYTLLTLYSLKSKDEIINEFKLIISPETYKIIDNFIYWLKSIGKIDIFISTFFKTLEYINTRRIESVDYFNNLKNWVKDNIEVKTSSELLKGQQKEEDLLIIAFGKSVYQTFILAREDNGVALIDDFVSRNYLGLKFNVFGIWTQSLLLHLKNNNKVSEEKYRKDTVILANLNYKFTSINKDSLFESIQQSKYRVNYPFKRVAHILEGDISSPGSLIIGIGFLVDFINKCNDDINDELKHSVTMHIITRLFLGRTFKDTYELIYFLLMDQAAENYDEANYILNISYEYIKFIKMDDVIDKHPSKYRFYRYQYLLQ
ncbi:MAG: hypothetical protein K8R54_17500 [Bacteroidales bacterium]|nr:hypothetical protein [Bacteroidales bacterium]